jgi:hypothetical protein
LSFGDSPAIDAGDSDFCPLTDQRGAPRPSLHGDVGAFEFVPTHFHLVSVQLMNPDMVRVQGTGIPNASFELQESGDFLQWNASGTGQVDRYGLFTLQVPRNPVRSFYRTAGR